MHALVIMVKEPVAGSVKTRLTPPLSPETARELYKSFILDKITQVNGIENTVHIVAYYPESGRDFFLSNLPENFELLEQEGHDLGERLAGISSELFKRGFKKVLMLDSDSPNLPTGYIIEGIERLDSADIVLGPTDDGGYYLIGLKEPLSGIFQNIPWSTPEVAEVTIQKIAGLDKTRFILPGWYDVDTAEDLERLKNDIGKLSHPGSVEYYCKNTIRSIKNIGEINK